jgi:hypothetical protein
VVFALYSSLGQAAKTLIMATRISDSETTMTLDDVYGSDLDRFPLEQEANWGDNTPPELEWDESEVATLVDGIMGQQRETS